MNQILRITHLICFMLENSSNLGLMWYTNRYLTFIMAKYMYFYFKSSYFHSASIAVGQNFYEINNSCLFDAKIVCWTDSFTKYVLLRKLENTNKRNTPKPAGSWMRNFRHGDCQHRDANEQLRGGPRGMGLAIAQRMFFFVFL